MLDVAYGFNMMVHEKWSCRSLIAVYQTLELFVTAAALPWAMFSLAYQGLILVRYEKLSPEIIPFSYVVIVINYVSVATFFTYLFYFLIKRRASEVLYDQKESIWRIIEVMIMLPINTFLVNIPGIVIASFSVLFTNKEFERS